MKITRAEFITSAVGTESFPQSSLPEIAFIGRSNVGKSSLINSLVQRKKLAKTSSTPGKTQMINFYRINDVMHLVDLPGYGFTKAPEKVNVLWRKAIDLYFRTRRQLRGVIQLVDVRHLPLAMDIRVCDWLLQTRLLAGVCAVKTDKISGSKVNASASIIRQQLGITHEIPLIHYSSVTGRGRDDLWDLIISLTSEEETTVHPD